MYMYMIHVVGEHIIINTVIKCIKAFFTFPLSKIKGKLLSREPHTYIHAQEED